MRLYRGVSMLAAAVTGVGVSTPAGYVVDSRAATSGGPATGMSPTNRKSK